MARVGPSLPVGGPPSPTAALRPQTPQTPPPVAGGPPDGPAGAGETPRRRRLRPRVVLPVAVLAVLVLALGWRWWDARPAPLTPADVDRAVAEAIEKARAEDAAAPPDGVLVYQTILPSLVTVTTELADETPAGSDVGLGAGTVIRADGAVLTALHVVDGGGEITVRFADGTESAAQIASRQEEQDLAVLAVETLPQVVVPAVLGGGVQVGDPVFPVGNPLGLERSLSAGVVSATERSVRTDDGVTLEDLIQFDAAVNPGNSGGPLLNRAGQVVGVVTALANPARQPYFVGIGFAAPIETAGGGAGGPNI